MPTADRGGRSPFCEEESVQKNQTVSERAGEVLERQAKALAHGSGRSSEDARQAVADTEAGRRLGDSASGEYRHDKAQEWRGVRFGSSRATIDAPLSLGGALAFRGRRPLRVAREGYMERLEGKQERERYYALLEEELGGQRGTPEGGDTLRRRASGASSGARKGRRRRAPASVGLSRPRDFGEPP
jgi:hypothetical protein